MSLPSVEWKGYLDKHNSFCSNERAYSILPMPATRLAPAPPPPPPLVFTSNVDAELTGFCQLIKTHFNNETILYCQHTVKDSSSWFPLLTNTFMHH